MLNRVPCSGRLPPVELGRSFSPTCLDTTLRKFARVGDGKGQSLMGQQQDAEEFLCFLVSQRFP
jgi:hypothetical protein